MRLHEQECVQRALGCRADQMSSVNLSQRLPTSEEIEAASAIMIGGSGAFHVYDDEPWIKNIVRFCGELLKKVDRPILGMCFGHQALLMASGAQIIKDEDKEELGTFEMQLTPAGKSDELFRGMPDQFYVQLGHVDRAKDLPKGWLNLADSASQPHEAVRLDGQPVWGFQFHAELRMEDNLYRVRHYADHYGAAREEVFDLLVAKHRPSPMGTQLMQRFAQIVTEFWENPTCIESPTPSVSL
jgi:GMP synthase (glutamine-hydrolysing)